MDKATCWFCQKVDFEEEFTNVCHCSTIKTKKDDWVEFKITEKMIGSVTCPLCECKNCTEKFENEN